ncbi:MAG: DUF2284 domain-containing protein [Firmicutes bacterium]|nr:DUF2284 domain-containing protein [Bacillota bacterium]
MRDIEKICLDAGFTGCGVIRTSDIPYAPELIHACEQNLCRTYGRIWVCPPAVPCHEEMKRRIDAFESGLVVQTVGQLEDSFDFETMEEIGAKFKQTLIDAVLEIRKDYGNVLALGSGGCRLCEKCTYPDAPCRFPDKAFYSVESCGIVVNQMVSKVGLKYNNGPATISYAGLILCKN